jgi:hypothetical protein
VMGPVMRLVTGRVLGGRSGRIGKHADC